MPLPTITLKKLHHRGIDQIGLYFDYNKELIVHTKKLNGTKWSATNKCWYIENKKDTLNQLFSHFKNVAWLKVELKKTNDKPKVNKKPQTGNPYKKHVSQKSREALETFRRWMVGSRYSESTINSYIGILESFFGFHRDKDPFSISLENVECYNTDVVVKYHYSVVYQRQLVSALKLMFRNTDGFKIDPDSLERPKRSKKLPVVLSREEVLRMLLATANLKHRTILAILYGSGLRISELINLRIEDIDFARKQLFIRMAKGRKDRFVSLSEKIYSLLNDYLQTYKPDTYLFNGQNSLQYSAVSVRHFLARSVKQANIKKRVTPHTLRHTYATHLLEGGVDLKYVQELLGHSRLETTQLYLHVTKKQLLAINSPIDTLIDEAKKEQMLLDMNNKT